MTTPSYIHAIQINTAECVGCSHCMRVCPTQAIRIEQGNACINPARCVDCGECFRVCPQGAIFVKDDELKTGFDHYSYKVALIPSVFYAQFPNKYTVSQISEAILRVGFNEVFEVEHAVDFLKEEYKKAGDKELAMPAISSYCPSVVRLIQVLFPSLTENILQLKAPHDLSAIYLRNRIIQSGVKANEIGIYYFTPCAAKIVAAKAPEGELESPIDVVVNMRELYNKVYKIIIESKNQKRQSQSLSFKPDSVKWSLSGTERKHFTNRCLAIDGVENVIEFLEKLESGHITDVSFLEMRVCDQGCAGGILCPGNRFLSVERVQKRYQTLLQREKSIRKIENPLMQFAKELSQQCITLPILPREGLLIDKDMKIALQKLSEINILASNLPGIDCGACGAPTCKSLAEDIVKGNATLAHCVFIQHAMVGNNKMSKEEAFQLIENIWGKKQLKKYNAAHEE